MSFSVKVVQGIKIGRLVTLSYGDDGKPTAAPTEAGGSPDFYTTRELKNGESVNATFTGRNTWRIEAGEDLKAGQRVQAGQGGTIVSVDAGGLGYVLGDAKSGELVEFYLAASGSGGAGEKGPRGDKGPVGDKGAKGDAGDKGPTGDKGPNGDKGPAGDKGPTGDKGPQGDKGPRGDKGEPGDAGGGE
ncbi:head fiber protein [Bacillus sp. FSL W7-1360]